MSSPIISITKTNVNFDELGLNDLLSILNEKNIDSIVEQFGRQTGGGTKTLLSISSEFLSNIKGESSKRCFLYTKTCCLIYS